MAVDVARLHLSRDVQTIKTIKRRGWWAVRREQLSSIAVTLLAVMLIGAITALVILGRDVPAEFTGALTLLIGFFIGDALSANKAPGRARPVRRRDGGEDG